MSDNGGDSDWEYADDQDDWLYVEDHYDEADQLAEQTCPSPAFHDGQEHDGYDPYDYWEDLTYLSDGVYDQNKTTSKSSKNTTKKPKELPNAKRPMKRKAETDTSDRLVKRRRDSPKGKEDSDIPSPIAHVESPILWRTARQQEDITRGSKTQHGSNGQVVSILKDWKERFNDQSEPRTEIVADVQSPTTTNAEPNEVGLELNNIQSIAQLLSDDHIEDLKNILKSRGLDPEAVEVVLKDLIAGNEPDFDDDDDDEDEDEDDDDNDNDDNNNGTEEETATTGEEIEDETLTIDPLIGDEKLEVVASTSKTSQDIVGSSDAASTHSSSHRPLEATCMPYNGRNSARLKNGKKRS